MHPLLTFSTGILAGAAAVRWLKSGRAKTNAIAAQKRLREVTASGREKTASSLDATQQTLREAAIAGLSAVEASSARLRTKLTPAGETLPEAEAPVDETTKPDPTESAES
ncbi:MAG: hypothetical protein IPH35_02430 [Rhodoferax sp.]|nr:hypothetical protein [Rhodoferax sp.]